MSEYVCTTKCYFNDMLFQEGAVVVAEDKDMKDNPCFMKVSGKKKSEDKTSPVEEAMKQVVLTKEQ